MPAFACWPFNHGPLSVPPRLHLRALDHACAILFTAGAVSTAIAAEDASGSAVAQRAQSLPAVEVRAKAPSKSQLSADPTDGPASSTLITEDQIAKQNISSYGDLLRPVTGITVNNFGQGGLGYGISLRGFVDTEHGKDVAIFVDGVPVNQPSAVQANGYADLNMLIPETIGQAEILRGPFSALYGNHALGGSVNFYTKDDSKSEVALSGGSYSTARGLGTYAARTGDKKLYSVLELYDTRGYRDNNQDRRYNSFTKAVLPFLTGTATIRFQLLQDRYGEPNYINRAAVESGAVSPRAALNPTDNGKHEQQNAVFNYRGNDAPDVWSSSLYLINNTMERTRSRGGKNIPGAATSQRIEREDRVSYGGTIKNETTSTMFGVPALYTAGASLFADQIGAARLSGNLSAVPLTQSQDRKIESYNPALFVQAQVLPASELKVTVGARYDRFYYRVRTAASDSIPSLDLSPHLNVFSPKVGVSYKVADSAELFANVARGFKAPSGYDELVENPQLRISKLKSAEAGVQGADRTGQWNYLVDVWATDQTAEVQNDPVSGALVNFGKTRRKGFDMEGRIKLSRDTALFANYSRVSAKILEGAPGDIYVTTVPKYIATLGIDLPLPTFGSHKFSLYLYDQLVGPKHLDAAGTVNSKTYTRISAKLNYTNLQWKGVNGFLAATIYPGSRLDETTFFSGGNVVTSPKAPVTLSAGLSIPF